MTKNPEPRNDSDSWTIRRVLAWSADDLRKRGASTPRLDAELLLAEVLGLDRVGLVIDADRPLAKHELSAYRSLHQRRRAGEPVAYLLGRREFYGLTFRVDRRVLVPRPETELLVEVALGRTRGWSLAARVLDLCTGSGCVAITLARQRPTTRVLGTDVSIEALELARENALRLGAVNAAFVRSDLFEALPPRARFELVTANPPYIPEAELGELDADVRDFEPHLALVGGADGLSVTRRVVAEAPRFLIDGGVLAVEIGFDQATAVRALFEEAAYTDVEVKKDLAGRDRVVSALKRPV